MQRHARLLSLALAAFTLLFAGTSSAQQAFPSRPVRIVVPFPPGGLNDIVARTLAPPLSKALGQPVLVENRAGGSSAIAAENVARSPADGHTLLIMGFSFFANAALRTNLPFDTLRDFTGVARSVNDPYLLAVNPSLPVKTLEDLVTYARARPGKLDYATNGIGTAQHITGEMLKLAAKIDMVHVPYQGDGPAVVAVLGGQTGVMISTITGVAAQVAAGKLRPIAVTSLGRFEPMKDVPTFAESGMPGFEMTSNLGFVMHSGTPRDIVARLGAEIVRAQELPEVKEPLAKQATKIASLGPAEYDSLMRAEIVKIQRVVREAKIKLD
jgi:tripartite-type tricarboxylate transporter receptor subunit TctC